MARMANLGSRDFFVKHSKEIMDFLARTRRVGPPALRALRPLMPACAVVCDPKNGLAKDHSARLALLQLVQTFYAGLVPEYMQVMPGGMVKESAALLYAAFLRKWATNAEEQRAYEDALVTIGAKLFPQVAYTIHEILRDKTCTPEQKAAALRALGRLPQRLTVGGIDSNAFEYGVARAVMGLLEDTTMPATLLRYAFLCMPMYDAFPVDIKCTHIQRIVDLICSNSDEELIQNGYAALHRYLLLEPALFFQPIAKSLTDAFLLTGVLVDRSVFWHIFEGLRMVVNAVLRLADTAAAGEAPPSGLDEAAHKALLDAKFRDQWYQVRLACAGQSGVIVLTAVRRARDAMRIADRRARCSRVFASYSGFTRIRGYAIRRVYLQASWPIATTSGKGPRLSSARPVCTAASRN